MIRDDVRFDRVLYSDMIYVGAPGTTDTPYSHTDNLHYEELEESRADLSNPAVLMAVTQSGLPGAQLPSSATAGVLTTRAAGEEFFSAGTNRRRSRSVDTRAVAARTGVEIGEREQVPRATTAQEVGALRIDPLALEGPGAVGVDPALEQLFLPRHGIRGCGFHRE